MTSEDTTTTTSGSRFPWWVLMGSAVVLISVGGASLFALMDHVGDVLGGVIGLVLLMLMATVANYWMELAKLEVSENGS